MTHATKSKDSPTRHHFIYICIATTRQSMVKQNIYTLVISSLLQQARLYTSSNMKTTHPEQFIGIPVEGKPRLLLEHAQTHYVPTPANKSLTVKQNKVGSVLKKMNRIGEKADKYANGIREHVRLGAKITETLKAKLSLGAKIVQAGGVKKVFRHLFSVGGEERLLKACQCYLSTSAGPIAGLLFISTHKLAFCSERLIKLASPDGKLNRIHYKVLIPLRKIQRANQSDNVKKPSQKYIDVETVDGFDFWFMGFLNYQKAFHHIQLAVSQAQMGTS